MSDIPVIREGRPEDAAACAAILNRWIDATPWMPRIHPTEDVERHYREDVFPRRTVWVAGTPVVGFLAFDPESAVITALYVATPGAGIGKTLIDHAKAKASVLTLWTFVANTGARSFYRREGFVHAERTEGDNEERLPDIRMEWRA
ncbi:MAG: GNAT family N-acetyltransferase [Pseudomonadota bacterium]